MVGIDDLNDYYDPALKEARLARLTPNDNFSFVKMNIADRKEMPELFADKQFDGAVHLAAMNIEVDIYDPWADPAHVAHEYGLTVVEEPAAGEYNAVVIAVAHREFAQTGIAAIRGYCKPEHVVYDVKYAFPASDTDGRL